MKRNRYLLDTCALIWLLQGHNHIKSFWEKHKDYYDDFAISIDSLKEILYKQAIHKLELQMTYKQMIKALESENLQICYFEKRDLDVLSDLPFFEKHKDPCDRHIIATAIAQKRVLVSGDLDFPLYEKHGLRLLQT